MATLLRRMSWSPDPPGYMYLRALACMYERYICTSVIHVQSCTACLGPPSPLDTYMYERHVFDARDECSATRPGFDVFGTPSRRSVTPEQTCIRLAFSLDIAIWVYVSL